MQALGRWLVTGGAEGELPDYYPMAQAARFWGVPPWVMAEQSVYWITVADDIASAESHKRKIDQQQAKKAQARAAKRKK